MSPLHCRKYPAMWAMEGIFIELGRGELGHLTTPKGEYFNACLGLCFQAL
jgi:hypothetical protein